MNGILKHTVSRPFCVGYLGGSLVVLGAFGFIYDIKFSGYPLRRRMSLNERLCFSDAV